MAQHQNNPLPNIRDYSREAHALQDDAMDFDASNIEVRLEQTVKELQSRVQEQKDALEKVCSAFHSDSTHVNSSTAEIPIQDRS